MGMFDTFISKDGSVQIQLKTGPCVMHVYCEGDHIDAREFKDGVYVAPDGYVVIYYGIIAQVTTKKEDVDQRGLPLFSKWGDELESLDADLNVYHPVQAMKLVEKKYSFPDNLDKDHEGQDGENS